jgi:transposase-like protein
VREMKTDGELPADTKVRSSKYLNNLIEQDHRGVKLRAGVLLSLRRNAGAGKCHEVPVWQTSPMGRPPM